MRCRNAWFGDFAGLTDHLTFSLIHLAMASSAGAGQHKRSDFTVAKSEASHERIGEHLNSSPPCSYQFVRLHLPEVHKRISLSRGSRETESIIRHILSIA